MSGRQTCLNTTYLCPMHSDSSVREQIIITASRLFLSQGYNLTGINQIIEEAGVAKASLYYHFPSKEDLGVAYLKRRAEVWFEGLNHHLEGITSPLDRLVGTFEYRAIFLEQNYFSGCSYTRILTELPQRGTKMHTQAVANKEGQRKYFQDIVAQVEHLHPEKKKDVADTVLLLYDGASHQVQVYKELWPIEAARKAVIELIKNTR
jgi:AcrR family transcriptional regulator